MKKTWNWALILGLTALMSACSSSPPSGDSGDEIPPTADEAAAASTDAVPPSDSVNPEQPPQEEKAEAPAPAESPAPEAATAEPENKPAPEAVAENAAPVAGSGQFDSYTTVTGDTLMKIAFETYGDLYQWKKIYDDNKDKISDPNNIPKGVSLKVEKPATPVTVSRNGEKYLIKHGDTLGTISDDIYGTKSKWKQIYENNKELIRDPNKIYAGFFLYYTMTPEEKEEADKLKNHQLAPAPLAVDKSAATPRAPAAAANSALPGTN